MDDFRGVTIARVIILVNVDGCGCRMAYLNVTSHVSSPTPGHDGRPLSPVELVDPF